MSEVIAVAGAGGKTGYIDRIANAAAMAGKTVAITTTTRIYERPDRQGVSFIGERTAEGKLKYPGDEVYLKLKDSYDLVLVEADGSKHYPLKLPDEYEPVIPEDADEIAVIMGDQAVGRDFSEVCFRYREGAVNGADGGTIVTEELIDSIAEEYYLKPLKSRYPDKRLSYSKSGLLKNAGALKGRRVSMVIPASGEGRRFGSNKLMHDLDGRPLFMHALSALVKTGEILRTHGIETEVYTVTDWKEVREAASGIGGIKCLPNPGHAEGIASSIRIGAGAAAENKSDAVLYLNADMPYFPAEDTAGLVKEFLCSGKSMGCAFAGYPSNPGIFSADMFEALMGLKGDSGALKLIKNRPADVHYYVVREEKLKDIDTRSGI